MAFKPIQSIQDIRFGGLNKTPAAKPATPAADAPTAQAMQDLMRALSLGPQGYTDAMRQNLGMDIQTGGAKPQSGMTKASAMPFGYQPVAATPDPLKAIIAKAPAPAAPAPTTPAPTTPTRPGFPGWGQGGAYIPPWKRNGITGGQGEGAQHNFQNGSTGSVPGPMPSPSPTPLPRPSGTVAPLPGQPQGPAAALPRFDPLALLASMGRGGQR